MPWNRDELAPVDKLLFRSGLVKVGCFQCEVDDPCFPVTESLDNDVFVIPRNPLWFRRGFGEYQFVESGSILLHRAGSRVERRRVKQFGDNAIWFGIHPDVFRETLQRFRLPTDEMGGSRIADPKQRYRLALLVDSIDRGDVSESDVEEEVLSLFTDICSQRSGRERQPRSSRRVTSARRCKLADAARAYIEEHLNSEFGISTVAQATGTSVYHLCRVFKEQTGLTLHAYRTRLRLGCIVDRMVSGNVAGLSELAHEFGFSSHSHLCHVFQRQMGVPPSALIARVKL